MDALQLLTQLLNAHSYLVAFFSGALLGEETIFVLTILATQGVFPLWIIFTFSYLGVITMDVVWFYLGRAGIFKLLKRFRRINEAYKRAGNIIDKYSSRGIKRVLLVSKSVYGIAILTLMHLGASKKLSFKKYLVNNMIVTLIWMIFIVSMGLLAGAGYTIATIIFKSVQIGVSVIILSSLAFIVIAKWFKNWLMKRQELSN
ncbi:MAG: hypothetical protein KKD18_04260 [Nanoarchaeota archaeon]|nr:hypothetical protein [Nanoarchaeota archaeon]